LLWPATHLFAPTLLLTAALLLSFLALDSLIARRHDGDPGIEEVEKLGIEGSVNLLLLLGLAAGMALPSWWRPGWGLALPGAVWPIEAIIGDGIYLAAGLLSLALTRPALRRANEFAWGPMIEVATLFGAIFLTLAPVSAMIAAGPAGALAPFFAGLLRGGALDPSRFYWGSGALSALLDNAPSYVVFFKLAGGDPAALTGRLAPILAAISLGATYFGAMTYIGNAPNLMVKALAESHGVRMPGFLTYIGWATLCLLPWLALIDLLFLRG
jgi:Na+/H+ antiporter NhaD/arsenite permease-like protein